MSAAALRRRLLLLVGCALAATCAAPAARPSLPAAVPTSAAGIRAQPVVQSPRGMVVSGSSLASDAGAAILAAGGNAVDAAVATAFVLAVVEPSMSGLGGRTQLLIRTPSGGFAGIDGTTEVPAAYPPGATPADEEAYGYGTIGIPGTVAALCEALERFGTMPLSRVLQPAIHLAEEGFALPADEAARIAGVADQFREFEASRRYFLRPDGSPYAAGEQFVQADLGRTLRRIAEHGAAGFYNDAVGASVEADMRRHGGWLRAADLRAYSAEPAVLVHGSYRGHQLTGTYLPASGATTIQIMQMLEHFELAGTTGSPRWAAILASAMVLAFEDRTADLGTPAEQAALLTSRAFAAQRAREIRLPNGAGVPPLPSQAPDLEPAHTTHVSVADAAGGVVALTQSVGPTMGSKVAAPGLGFVYAATMGYLGSLQPGERPFSSQVPFIVERDGELAWVLGAAGARRIISAVVASLSYAVDGGLPLPAAMAAPRLHASGTTIDLEVRPGTAWSARDAETLRELGFTVRTRSEAPWFGRVNGIEYDPRTRVFTGVADPRWNGAAAAPHR
jgi:gamma-glutamyltranspeptidase / glutathione hydrolase